MGRSRDAAGNTTRVTLEQATVTANANGSSTDIRGLDGRGAVQVVLGTPSNADNTIEVLLEDSADDSTFAAVTGATTGVRTSDVAEVVEIPVDFTALRRYVRPVYANVAGTGPSYETATIALGTGHVQPADE